MSVPTIPPEGRMAMVGLQQTFVGFPSWPHNRAEWPQRHVVVCEDNLEAQAAFAKLFARLFGPDHRVHVSFVPGAAQAVAIAAYLPVDLFIMDYDMPWGNGQHVVEYVRKMLPHVGIIGASGIPANNETLRVCGAHEAYTKSEFFDGKHDDLLRSLLG